MITQNPITGRAKKKMAGIYARTLYGKNVIQTCPPSTKGKQAPTQMAASSMFANLSQMSNQVSSSLLNQIFYYAPSGRSRRAEWCHQLAKGFTKEASSWSFDPSLLVSLGSNPKACETPYVCVLAQNSLRVPISELSASSSALLTELPCVIAIAPSVNQCISLIPYTTFDDDALVFQNLSPTLIGAQLYLYPLWKVNVRTAVNPLYMYGSFVKNE